MVVCFFLRYMLLNISRVTINTQFCDTKLKNVNMHIQHLFTRNQLATEVIQHICCCTMLMSYLFLVENATSISPLYNKNKTLYPTLSNISSFLKENNFIYLYHAKDNKKRPYLIFQ